MKSSISAAAAETTTALDLELMEFITEKAFSAWRALNGQAIEEWQAYLLSCKFQLMGEHRLPIRQGLYLISERVERLDQRLGEAVVVHSTVDTSFKAYGRVGPSFHSPKRARSSPRSLSRSGRALVMAGEGFAEQRHGAGALAGSCGNFIG